jgi:ribose/xylose/arabinose/galactoside ABC-type transport system permease subunit
VVSLGGGSFDVVAMLEIVFLIVCVVLGTWWFRRTNLFRAYRRSGGRDPGQHGYGWGSEGMYTHRATPDRRSDYD